MKVPLIQSIDHIMVRAIAAEPLYHLFSQTLGLPVSWPLQRSDFATFGWVTVGNTNLEFWAASNNSDLPKDTKLPIFHGFALGPTNLNESISTLTQRGVACKSPRAFITKRPDGHEAVNFTNSVILDVSTDSCCVFFCEWCPDGTIYPWREKLTASERQQREKAQLLACEGGPLGITGLVEIQIEIPAESNVLRAWNAITEQQGPLVSLVDGAQLRFLPGAHYKVDALVLGVRSLRRARDFLVENELLENEHKDELSLSRSATGGLILRLRESSI